VVEIQNTGRQQEGITTPATSPHEAAHRSTRTSANGRQAPTALWRIRVHTEEVTGSIPVSPTAERPGERLITELRARPFRVIGFVLGAFPERGVHTGASTPAVPSSGSSSESLSSGSVRASRMRSLLSVRRV